MPDKVGMRLSALILAGGRSERMGRAKEWLPFRSTTLLGHIVTTVQGCAEPVLVVARAGQALPLLPPGAVRVDDEQPGAGPLAAFATGLRRVRALPGADDRTPVFAAACDLPFLTVAAVQFLLERLGDAAVVMPRIEGHLQPLCGIYRCGTLTAMDALLQRGERMPRALVDEVRAHIVDEDELRALDATLRCFTNVNEPADWERVLRDGPP